MKKHAVKIALAVLAVALIAVIIAFSTTVQEKDRLIAEATTLQTNTDASLAETQAKLTETEGTLATTQAALTETEGKLAETEGTLASTQAALTETEGKLAETEATLATTQAALAEAEGKLAEIGAQPAEEPVPAEDEGLTAEYMFGTWVCDRAVMSGITIYADQVGLDASMVFDANGRCALKFDDDTSYVSWNVADGKLMIGNTLLEVIDGELYMVDEQGTIIFVKAE